MERELLGALGIGIALFSGLFAVMFAVEAASGGDGKTSPGVYAGLIVFFSGGFLVGTYLAWRMLRPRPPSSPADSGAARPRAPGSSRAPDKGRRSGRRARSQEPAEPATPPEPAMPPELAAADPEHRVLLFAEWERGRLTLAETAAHCDLTVAEAKSILDRLVLHQVAALHVTDAGVLVYVFDGFLSDDEKARARGF
jgi:hypothetical protein